MHHQPRPLRGLAPRAIAALLLLGTTGSAHAQDDTVINNIYVPVGGVGPTYIDDSSRWLFPGQVGTQVIEVKAVADSYCEEVDWSLFAYGVPVTGSLESDGLYTVAGGAGTLYASDVGCNHYPVPTTQFAQPVQVPVTVDTGTALGALFVRYAAKNGAWTATAVLDPTSGMQPAGVVSEGGIPYYEVTDNTRATAFLDDDTFALLSGKISFGALTGTVGGPYAYVLDDSIDCGGDLEVRSADLTFDLGNGWNPVAATSDDFTLVCATASLTSNGDYDLVVTGVGDSYDLPATGLVAGLNAAATVRLDYNGLRPVTMAAQLPKGTTLHRARSLTVAGATTTVPEPRGARWVRLTTFAPQTPVGSLDDISASLDAVRFVVSANVPLGFITQSLELTRNGFFFQPVVARYLHDLPVHPLDLRAPNRDGPRSNDVWLRNAETLDPARIDEHGLTVDFRTAQGAGATAFPRGKLGWGRGDVLVVEGGQLVPHDLSLDRLDLEQRSACPGCGSAGGATIKVGLEVKNLGYAAGAATDQTVLAHAEPSDNEIGWGPTVFQGGTPRPTFLRSGDVNQPGLLVLPGNRFAGGATPASALLGAWRSAVQRDDAGVDHLVPVNGAPVTDNEVRKGNGSFAGFNLGPELYRDAQNQPVIGRGRDLAGTTLSIAFPTGTPGAPDFQAIPANTGAKLVVRGTVTGVFNTNAANAPQPQVYGYNLAFTRFAFGLVDNTLAPQTWIDGSVSVAGPGDFGIPFTSLGLQCTGQLAGGVIDYARQTPQRLKAWKTPYAIDAIGFTPVAPDDQCSTNPRKLTVGGAIDVKALAKTINLSAKWSPTGDPSDAVLSPVQARLDALPNATPPNPGFPVQTKANGLTLSHSGDDLGWFLFDAKLFVPFWEAQDAKLRLQNVASGNTTTSAPSLVVPAAFAPPTTAYASAWTSAGNSGLAGMFTDSNPVVVDALTFNVKMQWVFELGGWVKWQPRSDTKPGRFIASKSLGKSLGGIVSVQAAVPYVTDTNTQYTFGADADLTKIQTAAFPALKIDLKDPDSLKDIDNFLVNIGVPCCKLSEGLGALRGAITSVSNTVKGLFGPQLKKVIKEAIPQILNTLGLGDLLDLAANAVKKVQSTAQQAITAVFGGLRSVVDDAVKAVVQGPDQLARTAYQTIPQIIADASTTLQQANAQLSQTVHDQIQDFKTLVLDKAAAALGAANTALSKLQDAVNTAKSALRTVQTELVGNADKALGFLQNISDLMSPQKLSFLKCDTSNPIIGYIDGIRSKIKAVTLEINAVAGGKLQSLVDKFNGIGGIKTEGFVKSLGLADGYAKLLNEKIDAAYFAIVGNPAEPTKPSLCSKTLGATGNKLGAIADKAREFLSKIYGLINTAKTAVNSAIEGLLLPNGPIKVFSDKLATMKAALGPIGSAIGAYANKLAAFLDPVNFPKPQPVSKQEVEAELDKIAGLASSIAGAGTLRWCSVSNCQSGTSFLGVIADKLAQPAYALIGQVESAVGAQLSDALKLIPFPSRDDLLQHLTSLIVDSPVIDDITALVTENLTFIEDKANEIVNTILDQLTLVLQDAYKKVVSTLSALLEGATAAFKDAIPIKAASVKGFADIMGDQVMALQLDAHFDLNKSKDASPKKGSAEEQSPTSFDAQMRVESWKLNGKAAGCGTTDFANAYDAKIKVQNLPFTIGGQKGLKISLLELGFSINNGDLIGMFGGITTTGELAISEFKLRNIAFVAAVGTQETYVGARAMAIFQGFNCEVAFFAGRACTLDPLKKLDPETAKFIPPPTGAFFGAYVHGGVEVPIISGGCALTISMGAEAALWGFDGGQGPVIGGLVGGSIGGKALCFVSIRGAIRVAISYDGATGDVKGAGEFFAGGGIGFSCDPETWTSAAAIEADDGCATVDVSASARFAPIQTDPVHTSGID